VTGWPGTASRDAVKGAAGSVAAASSAVTWGPSRTLTVTSAPASSRTASPARCATRAPARRATYYGQVMERVHKKGAPVSIEDLTHLQKVAIQGFVYASVFTYFGHPDAVLRLGAP